MRAKLKILEEKQNASKVGTKLADDTKAGSSSSSTTTCGKEASTPCFTAEELKEIIWERNELKTKLSDLTDIIAALKKNEQR